MNESRVEAFILIPERIDKAENLASQRPEP
jgi:hypothetical protein